MKKFLALLMVTSALQITVAQADSATPIADLPGGSVMSPAYGISDNGIVVGYTGSGAAITEGYRWTLGGGTVGLGTFGWGSSGAMAISGDGSTIVGFSSDQAFRWTAGGGMVGLGFLPSASYPFTTALAVNTDGSVIVGNGKNSAGANEAFRWTQGTGMVGLGDLAGGSFDSNAKGVSGDGSIIVGWGRTATGYEAFRWEAGVMSGIGFVAGDNASFASGISRDGSVIVGQTSNTGNNTAQVFRYTVGGGMVGLGNLGGTNAYANAVNGDGSVIVGTTRISALDQAFVWTQTLGMMKISDLLTSNDVDMTGWRLSTANGVNNAGTMVVGNSVLNGVATGYVANITTGGLTTPVDLGNSLNTVAEASQGAVQQSMQYAPQGLFAAQNLGSISAPVKSGGFDLRDPSDISPAAGDFETLFSVFALGSYGIGANNDFNNDQWNGTLGISAQLAEGLNIGGGLIVGTSRQELDFDGKSNLDALGGLALVSYEPGEEGFRLYATAYAADLKLEIKRGYQNGAGLDSSLGKTDGTSYGTALKLGWETALDYNSSIMPYIEGRYAKTKLDAFEEEGGAFAAAFSKQDNYYAASRLGIEFDYKPEQNIELTLRPAWGHRLTGDNGSFTADVSGLTQSLSTDAGDRNWAELTVGAKYEASDKVKFTAELTGRSGDTAEPAANIMLGTSLNF